MAAITERFGVNESLCLTSGTGTERSIPMLLQSLSVGCVHMSLTTRWNGAQAI